MKKKRVPFFKSYSLFSSTIKIVFFTSHKASIENSKLESTQDRKEKESERENEEKSNKRLFIFCLFLSL